MIKQAVYDSQSLWETFYKENNLTDSQLEQFKNFYELLQKYNSYYNLTTVIELKSVIHNHFQDSLALANLINLEEIGCIVDVGSGGGFPGLPLKIVYPHLNVILIEVIHKKVEFLTAVINQLSLKNIETCSYDWRTFLRKTDYKVDFFCARASLSVQELLRLFKPSCYYKDSKLVYWASNNWVPLQEETQYITKQFPYSVGNKKRNLVLFENRQNK